MAVSINRFDDRGDWSSGPHVLHYSLHALKTVTHTRKDTRFVGTPGHYCLRLGRYYSQGQHHVSHGVDLNADPARGTTDAEIKVVSAED